MFRCSPYHCYSQPTTKLLSGARFVDCESLVGSISSMRLAAILEGPPSGRSAVFNVVLRRLSPPSQEGFTLLQDEGPLRGWGAPFGAGIGAVGPEVSGAVTRGRSQRVITVWFDCRCWRSMECAFRAVSKWCFHARRTRLGMRWRSAASKSAR